MAAIEQWGDVARTGLDEMIADQRNRPLDFKSITDSLVAAVPPEGSDAHIFFLSMLVATAVIELAGRAES